jgi:hypothetical protein
VCFKHFVVETFIKKLFTRGSIEMNIIKQIASRGLIYVLAVAILGTGFLMSGDNQTVGAEKLSSVYLTNKGTAKTTEASPPVARANPSSRVNASTLYATMTDVTTANAVKNSHILDANKLVITVVEPDFNTKVSATSANFVATAANSTVGKTLVIPGKAGNPVIDSDGDGDLSDEVGFVACQDGQVPVFTGNAVTTACAAPEGNLAAIVSVANGDSATNATATPMITVYITSIGGNNVEDNDDMFVGYYSSAVNTFRVKAWSTVQLEANASMISVVETGRNTGVFEAEFIIADTEGANDGAAVAATTAGTTDNAGNDATSDASCGTNGVTAAGANTAAVDGRFDRSGGIFADCEMLVGQFDRAGATAQGASVALTLGTLPAGQNIADADGDGILYDEIYFLSQSTEGIAADNVGPSVDGNLEGTAITCGGTLAKCTDGSGGAVVLTVTVDGAAIADNTSDKGGYGIPMVNNVVDNQKVDTGSVNGVTAADDLLTGRPGSDTDSTLGGIVGTGSILTSVFVTGVDRTPVVEAQANSVITVQYQDLTDNNSSTTATVGTKVKATATIDVDAPTPVVTSPTNGSSFKDRQPSFAGSATDIGSGLDVSTVALYVDVLDDGADAAVALQAITLANSGAWLGGAKSIDLQDDYRQVIATLDNTTTMTDGVTSATWTVTTSTNIPCLTVNDDGSAPNSEGGSSHTNFANIATTCATAKSEPDVSLDYFSSATDIAGNRGFSDATTTDTDDGPAFKDNYSFNIDELKPSLDAANTETGVYWKAATTAEGTGDATKIVVAFDDEISAAPAASFEVTTDAGTVLTPISTEIGTKGTTAAGVAYDKRKDVYLTLGTALASSDTPKVKLVGNVTDLAGNSNKSGNVANAADKIKPTLTLALSGGSGTGASPDDSVGLTKSAMTFTITTSEVLSTPPTVSVFSEDYGSTGVYEEIVASLDLTELGAGSANAEAFTINAHTVVDTDKDGSLTDEIVLAAGTANPIPASQLVNLAINSVVNSGENVIVTLQNNNSVALTNNADQVKISGNNNSALSATSNEVSAEGTVAAIAVDATTYSATFDGSSATFSDAAAKDSKAVVVSAADVNSNTGTIGTRDQGASTGLYKFRLDKTAPVLNNDPDGDGTVGSTTTLPRPYVIFEFTDNSKVTLVSASFGADDVVAKLATTNSKKYFMVPEADLTAKTYAVKAKGTDLAGNKGSEGSYNMKVSTRKAYKATILAGWNLMSFPSDPISNDVSSVFTNAGIDQVVGYDAMAKGSPWAVATKDSATALFSGGLETISAGSGYWVHSTEFSSQSVSLTGPEGPSASAPPAIEAISLASGWNLVGITDATKAKTQANEGDIYKGVEDYLGAAGGSSVTKAFSYNTTNLAWSEKDLTSNGGDVLIGEAYWVYAKPDANGMLTPIVP